MERTAQPKPYPRFKPPFIREWRQAKGYSLEYVAGNLISRDPTKDGKVIDLVQRLSPDQLVQAERVLTAMFA